MNLFLLVGLFLNTAQAIPDTYIGDQAPKIIVQAEPKNEIRVGACFGEPCAAGLQLEYGTPKYTVGASSSLFYNTIFAQYNVLSSKNDRLRAIAGIRGYYYPSTWFDESDQMGVSAYVGPEFHRKYITLRGTAGVVSYFSTIQPAISAELLFNFRLK